MSLISTENLKNITAGTSVNATLINSISKIFNIFIETGQMLGSSIRRIKDKKLC